MSKCIGCGAILQIQDSSSVGYTNSIESDLCERCFRIRNYNEYKYVAKNNDEYILNLKHISKTNDLVVLVVDLFNINKDIEKISNILTNDILLVLTKRDLLPKSCYDKNFLDYFNNYNLNIVDTIIVSSKNNYNFDDLYNKINKYKKSNNVYVVGITNAGKSTMINKILYNYSNIKSIITTSNLPSTTLDLINVKIDDTLTLIDTPGLLNKGDIVNFVDSKMLKKIIPTHEIKPITYQIKNNQTLIIDNIFRLDVEPTNLTLYMSNKLNITRVYKDSDLFKNKNKREFSVNYDEDLVIQGLGFINFKKACVVTIYIDDVDVYIRKGLI